MRLLQSSSFLGHSESLNAIDFELDRGKTVKKLHIWF